MASDVGWFPGFLIIFNHSQGNERLQEMMGIMAHERGGRVFATDERPVAFPSFYGTVLKIL